MERQPFYKILLAGIGYVILGNVMCLFMTMGITMFGSNLFTKAVAVICGAAIFFALVFTVAWKDGDRERRLIANGRVEGEKKLRWVLAGVVMFAVAAAPTVALLIDKLVSPDNDILLIYRLISGSAYPFVLAFVPAPDVENVMEGTAASQVEGMSVIFPLLMIVYYAVIPAMTYFGYWCGVNDKLNKEKIMYK